MAERTTQGRFGEGNTAARTHGVFSFLSVGRMPKGCRSIRDQLAQMRRFLEGLARRDKDGEIPPGKAAAIHSAVMLEGERRMWWWYLGRKGDALEPDQFARFLTNARAALEARDRCLRGLFPAGNGEADPWAALLEPTAPQNAQEALGGPPTGQDNQTALDDQDGPPGPS